MTKNTLLIFFLLFSPALFAQVTPPGLSAIKEADLMRDLYAFADPRFNGRSAGTIDELKAAAWLAAQYRAIGLKPAGDDNSYFQFFSLWRNVLSPKSVVRLNNKQLLLWQDVSVAQLADVHLDAPILYLGNALDIDTTALDVRGKVVAIEANAKGIDLDVSLPTWRYNRYMFVSYGLPLIKKGATAIIFIADRIADDAWADATENHKIGTYDIEGGPNATVTTNVPVIWLHASARTALQNNATLQANLITERYSYPSVNVIGKVEGTDPVLKAEYLLYSGHTDAHGLRNVINSDSVYHGADDNGSVNVAMLANARAFVKNPGKRSVLFVIHGAEERGLFGSKHYTEHPTVPLQQIVAVLNGDMIGRNHIDSAAILGAIPPHRTSPDLVNMALSANNEGPTFKLDNSWDLPTHKEGWFFRSDHLPYARLGIPSLMYTTLLHQDYHTPLDNAQNINYKKLKKMADWMYRTGWKITQAKVRPARERNFKLER